MLQHANCHSLSSSPCSSTSTRLPSVPENGLHNDVLNISPQPSYGSDSSTKELMKEIATLEVEVMHLEGYLLSLYRTAFEQHLSTLSSIATDQASRSFIRCKTGSPLRDGTTQSSRNKDNGIDRGSRLQPSLSFPIFGSDNPSDFPPPSEMSKKDLKDDNSGLRSLADHFGVLLVNHIPLTSSGLSENIIRCIAAIYCKFAEPSLSYRSTSASLTSSLSSSSTFSQKDDRCKWSPQSNEEDIRRSKGLKDKNGPYIEMLEVPKICLDGDGFNYASKKLKTYRSLVQHLEKVDPMKMKREEKLAFWINIHNALVMHAYLAYGGNRNRMKSASLILKWLQKFFSTGSKIETESAKHAFALDYTEPLVYFALASGAYSDPAVQVYTAKSIQEELHLARDEFIQASVSIFKKNKIVLPKILYYFAKDAALNLYGLLDMVHGILPETQQRTMERCRAGSPDKYIEWSSYNTTFRYIVHRELVKRNTYISK